MKLLTSAGYVVEVNSDTHVRKGGFYLSKGADGLELPLSALSIELTNFCNLNCKHCYGSFGAEGKKQSFPTEWILNSLEVFNAMQVYKIAITGGEALLHPDFITIVRFFLENGFDLTVFTNGTNPRLVSQMLEKTKGFYYVVKVSLDGMQAIHNSIRGDKGAFTKVLETLTILTKYKNIRVMISTTVMQDNISDISALGEYISGNFPEAIWTKDLVFPVGNALAGSGCSFSIDEFDYVNEKIPGMFKTKGRSQRFIFEPKPLRCTGGITQGTLTPSGVLKICNAASRKQFCFMGNVFTDGLEYVWKNCGDNINKYRKEKLYSSPSCKKCDLKKYCHTKNCRVLAAAYTGSEASCSPLSCFSAKLERTK